MRRNFSEIVEVAGTACKPFDGSRKYISTGSVHHDSICDNEVEIVNFKNKPSRANLEVNAGDILFAKMQGTRKTLLIDEDLSRNIYSTGFYAIKPKSGVITEKCLYYLVDSSLFLGEKDKKCSGATQKAINNYGLKQIELKIPNYHNQAKIGEQLDLLFSMIRARRHQINQLDNLIKARFVEMFGDKYPNIVVGDKLKTTSGGTPSKKHSEYYDGGTIPWLTSGEVNAGIIRTVKNRITEEAVKNSSAKMIPENSILVAMYGATAGQVGLLKIRTTTNQAICSILPNEKYLPEYLYHAMASKKDWMISQSAGGAQPNISQSVIRRMEIVDAPIAMQNIFVKLVHQVDKSKFAVQESLEKTQQLFDSLMQEYFG